MGSFRKLWEAERPPALTTLRLLGPRTTCAVPSHILASAHPAADARTAVHAHTRCAVTSRATERLVPDLGPALVHRLKKCVRRSHSNMEIFYASKGHNFHVSSSVGFRQVALLRTDPDPFDDSNRRINWPFRRLGPEGVPGTKQLPPDQSRYFKGYQRTWKNCTR